MPSKGIRGEPAEISFEYPQFEDILEYLQKYYCREKMYCGFDVRKVFFEESIIETGDKIAISRGISLCVALTRLSDLYALECLRKSEPVTIPQNYEINCFEELLPDYIRKNLENHNKAFWAQEDARLKW